MPEESIIGLDLGSTTAKFAEVLFTGEKDKFSASIQDSRILPSAQWQELAMELEGRGLPMISTGYFRSKVEKAELSPTEITTARLGAGHLVPGFDVLVDIGGQDIKLFDARTNDFRLNDKCSAGTGAFFDFVAGYFQIKVEELSGLHFQAQRHPTLNSTCTVFALSEMISRLVEGYTRAEVVRGLNYSFGGKIASLLPGDCKKLVLMGGVAKNRGVAAVLSELTEAELVVPENCQLLNALGAAIYGFQKL